MTRGKKIWRVLWRVAVCALLLGWIFQAIFYNEGRIAYEEYLRNGGAGLGWEALSRMERLRVAWTLGPPGLWLTLQGMDLKYLVLSIVLMGVLLLLGVETVAVAVVLELTCRGRIRRPTAAG